MDVALKFSVSDPMLTKPKCISEKVVFELKLIAHPVQGVSIVNCKK